MEDAWHFTNILTENAEDFQLAFNRFTALRMQKTTGITIAGRQLASSIFNSDPDFCSQRNLIAKATNYQALVEGMARGWASGLPL
jgi:FAD-dependent urate hydroxylase